MLNPFHKTSLFHIFSRNGYGVWIIAAVLILGTATWSNSFVFPSLPSNFQAIFSITRQEYRGTEIGLAIVKKIVERREEWIWVDSEPGHGSTFFFSVPDEYAKWDDLPA